MKNRLFFLLTIAFSLALGNLALAKERVQLPTPSYQGQMSLETAMAKRFTNRDFNGTMLTLKQVAQFLWAANGQRPDSPSRKVIPSAGALYPLEIFLIAGEGKVENLSAGIYQYSPKDNTLKKTLSGDKRSAVANAALGQMWLADAPAMILIAAVYERTTVKYGERGIRYVHMESGMADQDIFLQAQSLGLNAGTVGAFDDDQVSAAAGLPEKVKPLLLVAVGQ